MDEALDLADGRRARKLRIAVRLVFYPLALGLIASAWWYSHDRGPQPRGLRPVGWQGVTSQGRVIKAVTAHGRVEVLNTYVVERCSDQSAYTVHWFPGQRRFIQNGEQVYGHHSATSPNELFDGQVWATWGDHPRGTIRARSTLTGAHAPARCDSGLVTFSLRRAGG
jgi:hypothetical protein